MKLENPEIITEIKNHSREIRLEAEILKEKILRWINIDEAPKRENIEGITIDKESSKDLDDWIWAEKTKNWYSIFVSIADISEIIKPWTKLDYEAYSRATSVYTNNFPYHMFPSEISTDLASLNHKTKRLTLTTRIDLDNDYNVIYSEIFESIFLNMNRFNYTQFNKHFNNYWEEYHNELNLFHKIAKNLYRKRLWSWWKNDFKEKVTLNLNKEQSFDNNSIASFIVQEFAILSNVENAKINFKEKINGIFRLHMPEFKWIISSNKIIERAFYNFRNWYHYWLWENFYWHFTSPIRRYADLINHRQQKAWIRDKKNEVYNINQIREIVLNINSTVEKTIELEKNHNNIILNKKITRFLKKISEDNYNNLSSISLQKFSQLLVFFINNPDYLNNPKIKNEILYRIQFDLLDEKSIARIISWSNDIVNLNDFKELIKRKNEINLD